MKTIISRYFIPCIIVLFLSALIFCTGNQINNSLRVCKENPRYFTDNSGAAIYLTGAHTWNNLVDMGTSDPPEPFDYNGYMKWMQERKYNFFRLWTWELFIWNTTANKESNLLYIYPLPYERTGPGYASDGKPKFDLNRFNPVYFDRLRSRVEAAKKFNIYVSVMLFEGWGMQHVEDAWINHPFHPDNNINGIDSDLNNDGNGLEIYTLAVPEITAIQEAYVKKVIDTVNDLDNVLYEISNENHPPSTEWQYHMINFIHNYEKIKPKQHPVGMTFQYKGGTNAALFESPADWISPNPEGGYREDPPASDGSKVIINDTDHLWGIGGNRAWVWKSFLRGMNLIFMDSYDGSVLERGSDTEWAKEVRKNLTYTAEFAKRINLNKMTPHDIMSPSAYCLADPGSEYLVYLPEGKEVNVDISDVSGNLEVEWFNPNTGETGTSEQVKGGSEKTFISPFGEDDAVLYLRIR